MVFDIRATTRTQVLVWAILLTGMLSFSGVSNAAQPQGEMTVQSDSNRTDVVVLGASYAAGWKVSQLESLTFVNKGIGGQESHEMLARFEADVLALKPRYVILWGFINDIFRADRTKLKERLERTREDFRAMTELAQRHGIKPILATEVTTQEPGGVMNAIRGFIGRLRGKQSYARFVSDEVIKVNEWLRRYAKEQSIPVLDVERLFADEDGLRKRAYTVEDGSHITAEAYEALTAQVRQQFSELFIP